MNYAKDQSVVPADALCSGPSQHLGSKLDKNKGIILGERLASIWQESSKCKERKENITNLSA